MTPNVHFTSLVCPDYDLDLLPHWIRHYLEYELDSYKVFLHSPFENKSKIAEATELLSKAGFAVEALDHEIFGNGLLRSAVLRPYIASLPANDRVVTADSDEFHHLPSIFRDLAKQYDVIKGRHVDKYDSTLHDARPDIPLPCQYPCSGDVEEQAIAKADVRSQQRWPRLKKDKIVCCTVKYPVALAGSHCLLSAPELPEPKIYPFVFEVHHYTWRSSIIRRMANRDYYEAQHIWYYKRLFCENDEAVMDHEMNGIIKMEEQRQKTKGWVAVPA